MVSFFLSGNHPPELFSITENNPRLICDFPNAVLAPGIDRSVDVNGRFIRLLRIGIHKGSNPKIRVAIDLEPEKKYEIRPMFFKDDKLFTLIVQQEK